MASEGWYRNEDGLLEKKYDPHAALRAKQYERRLKEHQAGKVAAQSYSTNNAQTVSARVEIVRARAAQKREEKIGKARKFNQRHHERRRAAATTTAKHLMVDSHQEHKAYMDEFHEAFGLPAREPAQTLLHNPKEYTGATSNRISSWHRNKELNKEDIRTRWQNGPVNPRGGLIDASDRPLLCLSVSSKGHDCVVGSADHAAYGFDPLCAVHEDDQKPKRTLYSKRSGHAEWVTAVAHLNDTNVLSAGMDGKLILWTGTRATELQSYGASISTLLVDANEPIALACAYDGASTLWRVNGHHDSTCIATLASGSSAPALCACWRNDLCLIGDRDGSISAYSTESCSLLGVWKEPCGHVVSLLATETDTSYISGSQDGCLRFWDQRISGKSPCIHTIEAHRSPRGAGAVGCLAEITGGNLIASAGADGHLRVWDTRNITAGAVRDYLCEAQPHCLAALGPMLISGDAKGNILCHDTLSSRSSCCWGLGANRGAVRALDARPDLLVAVGDDGNALVWSF